MSAYFSHFFFCTFHVVLPNLIVYYAGWCAPTTPCASTSSLTPREYPDKHMCVTSDCVSASITAINSGPVGGWSAVAPDTLAGIPSIPITREHVGLILWLPPVIAILLSIWAMFPCCCRTSRWKKTPASCAAGCMICQIPAIFLFTALLWPLMMISGDVCATGANVGVNVSNDDLQSYEDETRVARAHQCSGFVLITLHRSPFLHLQMMTSYGDGICPKAFGEGTASSCSYSKSLSLGKADLSVAATVDFDETYR